MSKSIVSLLLASVALLIVLLAACSDEPDATSTFEPWPTATASLEPANTATPVAAVAPASAEAPAVTATPVATDAPAPAEAPTVTATPVATDAPAPATEPTVIEHGNARAIATEVAVGEAIAGAIDYEEDVDFFRFSAEAGRLYQIDVALGTLEDSELVLIHSDGWDLDYSDDQSRIVWLALEPGDYYVAVSSWEGTGSYTMTVSLSDIVDDHGNDTGTATAVAVGEDAEGSIDYEGDIDFFRFSAEAGQVYQIDVALGTLGDSEVALFDAYDEGELAYNDDHRDSRASRIVWPAREPGDYYVAVSGWGSTGSYTMTVSLSDIVDDHGSDTGTATAVAVGEDADGAIDYEGDTDFFRFSAEAGQVYQIDVALGTLGDSQVALFDSHNEWELDYNDDHGDSLASRIVWPARESGDYYVEVSGWEGTGSYTMTVSLSDIADDHGNDTGTATAVAVGEDADGAIDYEGDTDFFRFSAEAGQVYQIDVALGTLGDSEVALFDAYDEWELAYNDDLGDSRASRIVWPASESGDYYVGVSSWEGTGSYTMTVSLSDIADDHGNESDAATAVAVGEDAEGSIDYEGDIDFFRFSAEAGQVYQIDVALGTLEDSEMALFDSHDELELAYNDDHGDSLASRIVWPASESGDFYVGVAGWEGTGSYTMTVSLSDLADDHGNDTGTATAVAVGEVAEGAIDYEGDIDFFRFSAEAEQFYQIDVALGTLEDSEVALFDSHNEWELDYNDDHGDSLASRIVWPARESGDYYVEVSGWEGTGSYTMTVAVR